MFQKTRSHNVLSQSFSTSLLIEFCIQCGEWVTGLTVSTAPERHNGTHNVSGLIIKHGGSWWQLLLLIKKLHLLKRKEGFRPDRTFDWGTAHLSYKLMYTTEHRHLINIHMIYDVYFSLSWLRENLTFWEQASFSRSRKYQKKGETTFRFSVHGYRRNYQRQRFHGNQ